MLTRLKPAFIKYFPLHLILPFLLIALVFLVIPVEQIFDFDGDEGINTIKALLYSQGFSLYQDIWSDQPPLFTIVLAWWWQIFGQSMFAARCLVLLFSTFLVWSFYQILRLGLGVLGAVAGTLILINSHYYMKLSVSVMIGLPSLALALFSIYLLLLAQRQSSVLLLLGSGAIFALSLQTKLFTIFLIPLICLQLLGANYTSKWTSKLNKVGLWLFALLTTYILVSILCGAFSYEQLLQSHVVSRQGEELFTNDYLSFNRLFDRMFGQDYLFHILALLGILVIITTRNSTGLFPLAWLGTVCLLLANHKPVWYHHYLLVAIPLAWLAAYAVAAMGEFFQPPRTKLKLGIKAIIPILTALLSCSAFFLEVSRLNTERQNYQRDLVRQTHLEQHVLNLVLQHREQTNWIFTDKPTYAFYARLPVPPETAVLSLKRVLTGTISYDDMLKILQTYQPEQILLSNLRDDLANYPPTREYLQTHYAKVYVNSYMNIDYYLSKELLGNKD